MSPINTLVPVAGSRTRLPHRRAQRGLSLIGLLFVAAIVIGIAVVAMRIVPSALEYMAIKGAVEKVVTSGAPSAREVQVAFDRFAAVDDITSINGRDLIVEKVDGATVVSFSYEKRIELAGPVSLIIHYHGSSRR
ncbi:DUF4845 domain-containing protein [Burkholderiaceae bacterium FT117]|uniref:DUF4845 domain-containing protein n=1 Tax=Zeimonas sediminis TaxID=2944268 RepID=UPI0023430637|nr:DUF4845 domain-containing protein [Zeimonas sediminis]MCM5569015.1 DUF4845 domain-containing protein [Zeimonas sediminis]